MTQPSEENGKEPAKQANAELIDLQRLLESKLTDAVTESFIHRGMVTLVIDRGLILDVCHRLRDDPALAFDYLVCITSIDRGDCFEVVYNFRALQLKHELCLRVKLPRENPRIASVAHIWNAANWHEREAYDLMGIVFDGHPCLRRILLPEDWEGFPLRKDYEFDGDVLPHHQRRLCEIAAKMRGEA